MTSKTIETIETIETMEAIKTKTKTFSVDLVIKTHKIEAKCGSLSGLQGKRE
jgi:hypothetical protein